MHVELVRIGNSQGIRIPKPLVEELGLSQGIEMSIEGSALVLRRSIHPRAGWDEAMAAMNENGDDGLLIDDALGAEFDESEWQWQ
jgi:antitoxin MazE